ncbi:SpvB/TcaC N-terminal domain-containing protein [Methylomonas sp. MO1]|uniref:SpvB/TcaC N-terminal domain-containing protein n=1 Tax=Methylomonas sp. MO1 TaxID=3073619 RepID=UPI0028A4AF3C|nr:SpvB/TcaC N-terminal domain-containing protein [Methylomonas sp. MO1]MDT4292022.1 SpvB/TcaC N-terminal domain-containing protein [Methylomonas sp. MO1]
MEEQQGNNNNKPSEKSSSAAPTISLPKGGGAIRGMGEKFTANPVTGGGSMSVPIATSPGRSGFGPQLSLSYDSGAGNGPFGLGWSLALPSITRKTDKGLPRYCDDTESDVFILSGAEDLVPELQADGTHFVNIESDPTYSIFRYRPRIEGLFARIERWTNKSDPTDTFWRSISKDNIVTFYGRTDESRIFDPQVKSNQQARIFTWLICESYDDKGNGILYRYQKEDGRGIDASQAHELNRGEVDDQSRTVNRYLKKILYGNRKTFLDENGQCPLFPKDEIRENADWMFEAIFDYEEGHYQAFSTDNEAHEFVVASINSSEAWPARLDPFSSYRSGFEVRTYRICRRVLMFHHFPDELGIADCLIRSTTFTYKQNPVASVMTEVTQSAYRRQGTSDIPNRYLRKSLPSLTFTYSSVPDEASIAEHPVQAIDNPCLENLPFGLDGSQYQWVDLDGEGLSGILTEQAGAWYYKRNLSPIHQETGENGQPQIKACFAPIELVASKPSLSLASGAQLMDLAGDGQVDVVEMEGPVKGFYERTEGADWESFRPFSSWPNINTRDPNLRFIDLDGDGHADILVTEDHAFTWYPSLAEDGFGPAQQVTNSFDEEKSPHLVFADDTHSIFVADLSGDGLADLVRIRNGEVCYWPNLGYGLFGPKVTMDASPCFDHCDQFDPRRIRLADIDGTGPTDILYLHKDGVHVYFNQSGNRWSNAVELPQLPAIENLSSVQAMDLLGNGTACLVWSSPLPANARQPMRYIDLMGGQKPHLLIKSENNLGAETRVHYAPSTKFYLLDKMEGRPWISKLPFPVHVVEKVETYDHISRNRFVTRYAYHHGYFDGAEREFRGFGMVEQWDTEEFAALSQAGTLNQTTNLAEDSHVPPVLTKTWFHTGIYLGRDRVSNFFAGLLDSVDKGEYYRTPGLSDGEAKALLLDDTILPEDLTLEEEREACRSLKGAMLRQEVYALDGTEKQIHPYTITEQNFTIECLQHRRSNRHGVFFTHPREALSYHYERNPKDPRISHSLTLEVDKFGNVLKSVAIGYGRKSSDLTETFDKERQTTTLVTYTENRVTQNIDEPDSYRTSLPCEVRTYELTGYKPKDENNGRFTLTDFVTETPEGLKHRFDEETSYELLPGAGRQRRLIEHVRTLYRKDDLSALLPLGSISAKALPGESYKLAFTPGLLQQVYQRGQENLLPNANEVLISQGGDGGGYVSSQMLRSQSVFPAANDANATRSDSDSNWWIPAGRVFFHPNADVAKPANTAAQERAEAQRHFYSPRKFADPFGQGAIASYDKHDLLVVETHDAVGNTVAAHHDYRVLQPDLIVDPNGNRSQAAFDTLGMVVGTAVMGKTNETVGDNLTGFEADLTDEQINNFHDATDPHDPASNLLKGATTRILYDLHRFQKTREAHPDDPSQWLPVYAATLARETHASDPLPQRGLKIQISFSYSDGFGREIQKKIQAEPGPLIDSGPVVSPRWVGSGWTVFNNKGKPVRQYEPFFSQLPEQRHHFEFGVKVGVSPILFYDPLERVVATLHPNHTYEKVVFDPWQQTTFDVNDTLAANGSETGDPRTDADIQGYVQPYFATQPNTWKTWHQQRIGDERGAEERRAAEQASQHANTPTVAHFDTLGRPFLTVVHNRYQRNGAIKDEKYATRVVLDIEGNQRKVRDAIVQADDKLGRIVMQYDYDLLGNRIHQASLEAGERWMLNDVTGKPIRAWNSRRYNFRTKYDALRRPVKSFVQGGDHPEEQPPRTYFSQPLLFEKTVYGDDAGSGLSETQRTQANQRGKVHKHFDTAGVVTNESYDFKGNLLRSSRQFASDYQNTPNWSFNPALESEIFVSSTRFDALNRPVEMLSPHTSQIPPSTLRPVYNEANLLNEIRVNLRGAAQATVFVSNIDYNAKGQRTRIDYGNGAQTTYDYDEQTFRLTRLHTTRTPGQSGMASQIFEDPAVVQDLHYTYDPAGNITQINDRALKTVFHANQKVEAECRYRYDALYRLLEASGREHIGQSAFQFTPVNGNYRDYPFVGAAQTNDLQALRNYTELYEYDAVGNFERMIHQAVNGGWTRVYEYDQASFIEDGVHIKPRKASNQLSLTTVQTSGGQPIKEPYSYDAHGNMSSMSHLSKMQWDFKDQLSASAKQVVNGVNAETTFYVYDAGGQRVRKITALANGSRKNERLYLGGFEIYREYGGNGANVILERETQHVMDDKQRIALVETQTVGNGEVIGNSVLVLRYQLNNHLGSASLEMDRNGGLISYEEYLPYGSTSYQAGRTPAELSLKRYRYTGKERDEETGFSYHGARYYAVWLGRWANCDPGGNKDGANLFLYCGNNSISYLDRNGKEKTHADQKKKNQDAGTKKDLKQNRTTPKNDWDIYWRDTSFEDAFKYGLEHPDVVEMWGGLPPVHLRTILETPTKEEIEQAELKKKISVFVAINVSDVDPFTGEVQTSSDKNPGHVVLYVKNDAGQVLSTVSYGPINRPGAADALSGGAKGNVEHPIKEDDIYLVYEWKIDKATAEKIKVEIDKLKADPGTYTPKHQCSSVVVEILKSAGVKDVPEGKGSIDLVGTTSVKDVSTPYHLNKELEKKKMPHVEVKGSQLVSQGVKLPTKK